MSYPIPVDATANGRIWHTDGTSLYVEDSAVGGFDDTTPVQTVLETAWIALAGIQGFQRIYEFALLARSMQSCIVKLEVGYDYNETYAADQVFNFLQSGAVNPLQIKHQLTVQKCEAIRFRLTTGAATGTGTYAVGVAIPYDVNIFTIGYAVTAAPFQNFGTMPKVLTDTLAPFATCRLLAITGTANLPVTSGPGSLIVDTVTGALNIGSQLQDGLGGAAVATTIPVGTTAGSLSVGDIVTGAKSGATGIVLADDAPGLNGLGTVYLSPVTGTFAVGGEYLTSNHGWAAGGSVPVAQAFVSSSVGAYGGTLVGLTSGAIATISASTSLIGGTVYALTLTGTVGSFTVGETVLAYVTGEGVRLTSFALTVGLKAGLNRVPTAQRF